MCLILGTLLSQAAGTAKQDLGPHVEELLALKAQLAKVEGGAAVGDSKPPAAAAPQVERSVAVDAGVCVRMTHWCARLCRRSFACAPALVRNKQLHC
jgi:hypothetical protein